MKIANFDEETLGTTDRSMRISYSGESIIATAQSYVCDLIRMTSWFTKKMADVRGLSSMQPIY